MVHPACPLNVECKKTMHIMENNRFKVIIVEDVKLELKGTEEIFRHEIPNAEVIGTAMTENEFWELLKVQLPDMVLLDLGLGGSTTIGVEICSSLRKNYPDMKVLMIEKGRNIEDRQCPKRKTKVCVGCQPCSITTGCTGGDGWQETGFQLSHSGENSGTFQAVGGSGAA